MFKGLCCLSIEMGVPKTYTECRNPWRSCVGGNFMLCFFIWLVLFEKLSIFFELAGRRIP